jgi:predicted O-methyltransferase YrrM
MKSKLRRRLTKPRGRAGRPARGASSDAAGTEAVERFVAEVVDRGQFTHRWALGDMPRWEPLFRELEHRPTRLLEIGSFEGLSTCYFLWRLPGATVCSVDTFAGSQEHQSESVDTSQLEAVFEANVSLVDATRVRKLVGDSKRVLLELIDEGSAFDLIYVDGSHLGLDVLVDAALSWRVLDQGGFLVFDDYPWAKLGEDPLLRPGPAVDAFRALVDARCELVFLDYQLALRRTG